MSAVLDLTEQIEKVKLNGVKPFRLSVKTYDLMIKHGILTANDKVELIEGEIIQKYTNGEKYRFTTKIYDSMISYGILTENDNVELIDGEIIEKMPKGIKHTSVTRFITKYFYQTLSEEIVIQVQDPILLEDSSEPEPDVVLARPDANGYADRKPTPPDILLVIEVSDTTLHFDRNIKGKIYAEAGIEQYLIVNVENNTIEDYRQPNLDVFQSKQTYKIGDRFNLVLLPEIEINVSDFFGNEG